MDFDNLTLVPTEKGYGLFTEGAPVDLHGAPGVVLDAGRTDRALVIAVRTDLDTDDGWDVLVVSVTEVRFRVVWDGQIVPGALDRMWRFYTIRSWCSFGRMWDEKPRGYAGEETVALLRSVALDLERAGLASVREERRIGQ